jgi:hypothetical protein
MSGDKGATGITSQDHTPNLQATNTSASASSCGVDVLTKELAGWHMEAQRLYMQSACTDSTARSTPSTARQITDMTGALALLSGKGCIP